MKSDELERLIDASTVDIGIENKDRTEFILSLRRILKIQNPFSLIDIPVVEEQCNIKKTTIFHRMKEGKFPEPTGITYKASWLQLQITDYIFQVTRHGSWSKDRADRVLDYTYSLAINSDSLAHGESHSGKA